MLHYLKTHLAELVFWCLIALAPLQPALATVGALIAIDLFSGVWAAIKRGETIKSSGFRRTTAKVFAYEGALILAYIVEQNLLGDSLPLVKVIGGWIGLTELKSISENLADITGQNIWKVMLSKLQDTATEELQGPPPSSPPSPPQNPPK